eukprot:CAMPEP_0171198544 /NCGR_PEP_ID=MMETSP0790-20130122/22996_1 /TAXON_ID=2925 /ORGANISM="Alexandrium catenella, Strain OF101" /LENGTH=253 /DNA_ID=CAMNT_0011663849 /DNA_START=46 /DNA_END=807 /DNA_ORIENTATION=-
MDRAINSFLSLVCCRGEHEPTAAQQLQAASSKARAAALLSNAKSPAASKSPEPARIALARSDSPKPMRHHKTMGAAPLLAHGEPSVVPTKSLAAAPRRREMMFEEEEAEEDRIYGRVEELEELVQKLRMEVKKHPKAGATKFTRPQNRYFAAVPAEEPEGNGAACRWQRWYRGRLAYWKDSKSYLKQEQYKGGVNFLSIVKVVSDSSSPDVTVRHVEGQERLEMRLQFNDAAAAKEWSSVLIEVRRMLQDIHV